MYLSHDRTEYCFPRSSWIANLLKNTTAQFPATPVTRPRCSSMKRMERIEKIRDLQLARQNNDPISLCASAVLRLGLPVLRVQCHPDTGPQPQ